MTRFSFANNKKLMILVLSAIAAFAAVVFAFAVFTDHVNRTTTLQTASFDAEGYAIDASAPDGYLTAGDTVDVVLEESNEKNKDIFSQVTMTAAWESPVPDTYPWDDISISVDGTAVSHSVNEDQTISFTLPKKNLASGSSGEQSNLAIQLPSDLAATGTIKFSFEQIKLSSGEWTYDYAKDILSTLNFEIDTAWNISKDQTTALGNPNRDVIALLVSGTSSDDYSLEIIKNGSETNTNYGQMMNWTAKEQTPWAIYKITDLTLSEGVTTIGCYAFSGESGITSLSLPSTVNTIGISAFQGSGLSGELVIPSTVMIIERLAFGDLSDVDCITFEHGSDDSLILPDNTSEGEETSGAFYVSAYVKTTLNFNGNTVAKQYNWVADQRMKVGISEVTLTYENIQAGKTAEPVLVINPSNYDKPQRVTYAIIDGKDYASVDSDTGVVTGIAPGSVKVQVTIVDANGETVTATFTLSIGGTLSDVQIGDIIYLNENGSPVEYIVVNQGIPGNSNLYDSSSDGTWLLRKDIYTKQSFGPSNDYANSTVHSYLNSTFLGLFDPDIQSVIQQAKIPYWNDTGTLGSLALGSNGLSTKVFLLSGREIGAGDYVLDYLPSDGTRLSYFKYASQEERIGYYNGAATTWISRSPYYLNDSTIWCALPDGSPSTMSTGGSYGIRPALILPTDAIINGDGSISVDHLVIDSASVTKLPDKTKYMEGDDFDPTGMEVTVTYKDGSSKTVSIDDLTIENGTNLSVDQTEISISYTDNGHTVDTTVPIIVEKEPIAMEDAEIGSTVILDVDGEPTEFIIVHQGNPDSTLYDASCDGTWLLMKDIYELRQWHSNKTNWYASSTIHSYLNSSFLSLLDTDVQQVVMQSKIPYATGENNNTTVASGSSGLSTKVFLLSCYEVGWTNIDLDTFPVDGASLSYFKNTSQTDSKRIAYFGNKAYLWWLRSPLINEGDYAVSCSNTGWWDFSPCTNSNGIRPALIMPSDAIINGDGTIDVSNVYFDIDSEPSQSGTLTYGGEEQTVSWDNYDSAQLTLSGTTSATDAGTYTAIFTPKKHYRWSNGTTDAKEVTWTIEKAAGSMEVSPASLVFDMSNTIDSEAISVARSGNGVVSATSSNTSVATASVSGTTVRVTKKAVGSADITISAAAGTNYTAPSNITVPVTVNASLKGISLNKSSTSLEAGATETLSVTYNPTDTTDSKTVIWTSSDPDVATVSNGTITAEAKGTTTITAQVGSYTASCTVSVTTAVGTTYEIRSDGYTYVLDKNGTQTDKYLTNGTFTTPESGSYSLEIHGGGGGGAGGCTWEGGYISIAYYYARCISGGGGGGSGKFYDSISLTAGDSYAATVGTGGKGGSAGSRSGYMSESGSGSDGTASTFGSYTASGGKGASGGEITPNGTYWGQASGGGAAGDSSDANNIASSGTKGTSSISTSSVTGASGGSGGGSYGDTYGAGGAGGSATTSSAKAGSAGADGIIVLKYLGK